MTSSAASPRTVRPTGPSAAAPPSSSPAPCRSRTDRPAPRHPRHGRGVLPRSPTAPHRQHARGAVMTLHTRFTERFGIEHPIVSAPMDVVSTAELATAVSRAGGLGLIGGGYGDEEWLSRELRAAADTRVGCGFITWNIDASFIDLALAHQPAVLFLSFGDAGAYVEQIHRAGVPLIFQAHDLAGVEEALRIGADGVCVQGGEAGGHGKGTRSTFTLVPEAADLIATARPDALLPP